MTSPLTDSDIKKIWRKNGGSQHGPHVETYTIPEVDFWRFIAEIRQPCVPQRVTELWQELQEKYASTSDERPNMVLISFDEFAEAIRRGSAPPIDDAELLEEAERQVKQLLTAAAADRVDDIAKIIDPHSFLDIPFTDDPALLDMVEQSKQLAIRKAGRIISALAARSAPEAGKAVVKPLEWTQDGEEDADDIADTICGRYWVARTHIAYRLVFTYQDGESTYQTVLGERMGREAAKAAAQADYEQRILSALASSGAAPVTSMPTGAKWCQPGDQQTKQHFLVRFDDPDCREAVFTEWDKARAFYAKATLSWNCWLFATVPAGAIASSVAPQAIPAEDIAGRERRDGLEGMTGGLTIHTVGGNCPVQAEGTIDGVEFYFRARGNRWSLSVGGDVLEVPDWHYEEPYGTERFAAGWMTIEEAEGFIDKAAAMYRARNSVQDSI